MISELYQVFLIIFYNSTAQILTILTHPGADVPSATSWPMWQMKMTYSSVIREPEITEIKNGA